MTARLPNTQRMYCDGDKRVSGNLALFMISAKNRKTRFKQMGGFK